MFNLIIAEQHRAAKNLKALIKIALILLFTLNFSSAHAQDFFPEQTDYGFRFGADFDLPGKNLSADYRPGVNYNLSLMRYFEKFTVDVTAGYRQFQAKYPTLSQATNTGTTGVFTTSPFESFALSVGAVYNLPLGDNTKLYGGLNSGFYFTSYSVSYQDENTSFYEGSSSKQAYVAPKIGAAFAINNNLDFDVHAAYNVFTEHYEVNSRTGESGTLFTSFSAGVGLVFKF
ncbi:hypothetical protein ABZR88_01185 [Mucilaginibacter yixingensis]|nr:hypothetical protein [Mucilaginibacter yixingensis]